MSDPPSVSSISRLLRGGSSGPGDGRKDDDGRKDYSIHGILGGKFKVVAIILSVMRGIFKAA